MSITNHAVIGGGVEIRLSSIPGSGNGLWTCRPFQKNDLITEYCGPLIDYEKACKLRRQGKHTHVRVLNSQWLYINGLQEPLPGVGGASFANDARDPDVNNSAFIQKFDYKLGRDRVFIKACRDLNAGEEVFVSYGSTYWRNSRVPARTATAPQYDQQEVQCQQLSRHLDMQEAISQQQQVHSQQQTSEPSSINSSQTYLDLLDVAPPAVHNSRATRGLLRQAAEQASWQQQQQQQATQHVMQPGHMSGMQNVPLLSGFKQTDSATGLKVGSQPVGKCSRMRSQQLKHETAAAAAAAAVAIPAAQDQPDTPHTCGDLLCVTRSCRGSRKRTRNMGGLQQSNSSASGSKRSCCVGSRACSNTHSMASRDQQLPSTSHAAPAASRVVNLLPGSLRQAVGNAAAAMGGAAIAMASRVGAAR